MIAITTIEGGEANKYKIRNLYALSSMLPISLISTHLKIGKLCIEINIIA